MRVWTAHLRPQAEPQLLREGFSWGAFVFGAIWLAVQRAWVAAALALAASVLIGVLSRGGARAVLQLGLACLLGLIGRDLVRWQLGLRGYRLTHVLSAHDADGALARLLAVRPDLAGSFMPPPASRWGRGRWWRA